MLYQGGSLSLDLKLGSLLYRKEVALLQFFHDKIQLLSS